MRISIMTDIEGCAGIINSDDWCKPAGRYYEKGKRLLTEETNACIRGFFDAGADEVVVMDGHGAGAIDTLLLDERAEYSRGWAVNWQFGLNDGFDAFAIVGQHAKAGTVGSHITHSNNMRVIDSTINRVSVGEYGECVYISGFYGTPVIFASGERAFCAEAKALTPWVHIAETKYGVTADNGRDLDFEAYRTHNLGAVHVHPTVARERIYKAAKAALEDFIKNPEKFPPLCPEKPFTREVWYRRSGTEPGFKTVQSHAEDIIGMFNAPEIVYPEGTYKLPY